MKKIPVFFRVALLVVVALAAAFVGLPANYARPSRFQSRSERMVAKAFLRHRNALRAALLGEANPASLITMAPFLGNLTAVQVPTADAVALGRQADCSLTLTNYSYNGFSSSVNAQVTGYEKTLHANSFLSTTPDVFASGCTDSTAGLGSRYTVYLGKAPANGQEMIAVALNSGIGTAMLQSDGTLTTSVTLPTDKPPYSMTSADLNKDGNPDLVSINNDGINSSVTVFLGNADGSYQAGIAYQLTGNASFGAIADLNKDGVPDILVVVDESFAVFIGKGDGTFAAPSIISPAGGTYSYFNTFALGDFNNDKATDVVFSNGQVFLGKGDGATFTLAPQLAFTPNPNSSNSQQEGIVIADFNHDGNMDIATDDEQLIRIFNGNGAGAFTAGPAYAAIFNRGFLLASDLDGDGNLDLISGYNTNGLYSGDDYDENIAYAVLGDGTGAFSGAPTLPFRYTGTNLLDLNGDGRPDLVGVIPAFPNTAISTYLTNANGIPVAGPTFNVTVSVDSLALGAFNTNSNSTPGLIYLDSNPNGQSFYVAAGKGDGSFGSPTVTPVPSLVPSGIDIGENLSGLRVADFNHDGKLDIAYWFYDVSSTTNEYYEGFAVQLGNGDGTFAAPKITYTYQSATQPAQFPVNQLSAIQDVTGDNFPDVLMVVPTSTAGNIKPNAVLLFVGNGDGTFKSPNTLALTGNINPSTPDGDYGSPFAFGDLNGDGKMDLIAEGFSNDGNEIPQVAIALGNGDGTFQPATILSFGGFGPASGLAIADFNGDGKLDMAVEGQELGIFPGNGDSTFATIANGDGTVSAPSQIALNVGFGAVATDLNHDGVPDLISGNVILINKASATPPATAPTTTALSSSLNPSTVGASVKFTATVTSSTAGTITGSVAFFDGATQIGTGTIASGAASFTTAALTQGTHSITAQYGGDSNYSGSTSTAVSQVVNASAGTAATSTMLTSSPNPSTVGAGVSFTATVTSTTPGTISGSVSFYDGAQPLDTPITMTGNIATYVDMNLAQGTHTITAHYNGNANYAGSTSQAVSQLVNAAQTFPTMTTLSTSTTNAVSGTNITFTATVAMSLVASKKAQAAPAVTGTVTFYDGSTQLGTGAVGTGGVATYATSALTVGSHSITAQYGGDANYGASTSMAAQVTITSGTGSFTMAASPSSVTVTQSTPATSVISVTPSGGFNQAVALACSGLPSGFNCTFGPPTVTPNGAPATSTLTITDGEPPSGSRRAAAMLPLASGGPRGGFGVGGRGRFYAFAFIGELALLGLAFARRKRAIAHGGGRAALAALVFAMAITFMAGCSGGPGTQVVSVTVTGTAGTQSASTTISATLPK